MKYTIGEMSQLLGVTSHMLRHYEKLGIIRPEINQETGYRYYSVIDTRRFTLCRLLFTSGIPLEQCRTILQGVSQEDLEQVVRQQVEAHQKEIQREKIAIRFLQKLNETYQSLEFDVGKMRIEYYPRRWRLVLSQNEEAICNAALEQEREEWLKCQPATYWVSRIPNRVLRQFSQGHIDYDYGLMCTEEDALALGLRRTANVEIIPAGDYLVTLHRKISRDEWKWEDIHAATAYLQENSMSVFGDAFSNIVASRIEDGKIVNYHSLKVKIFT